jgi:hypothetical protein
MKCSTYQLRVKFVSVQMCYIFVSGFLNVNKVHDETGGNSWEVTTFDGFCIMKKVFTLLQASMEIEQLSG